MFAVKAEKVNKYYKNGIHGKKEVLKNVSVDIDVTIVLTTHYMKEAEELCGRIAFIKKHS
jgi:ABC-type uncharacterized transport system ATPase subunit